MASHPQLQWSVVAIVVLSAAVLGACSQSPPAAVQPSKEPAAVQGAKQQASGIQKKTDQVQQSLQQSEQRVKDAEQQAEPNQP